MANQPPARPWFRLPTMGRQPAAPAPAPQPQPVPQPPAPQQPRIPIIRPAFRPAFAQAQSAPPPPPPPSAPPAQPPVIASSFTPTQPPGSASPPPPSPITSPSPPLSLATAPSPPPVVASPPSPMPAMTSARSLGFQPQEPSSVRSPTTYSLSPNNSQLPTPTASPKAVERLEPQSSIKTTRSPPPISLPPSQFNSSKGEPEPRSLPDAEQEKVLLQETFNKKVVFPTAEGNSLKGFDHNAFNNSSKYGRRKGADGRKSSSDSDDGKNVRIITMTGENKGALMELDLPSRRDRWGGKHGNRGKPLENSSGSDNNVGNYSGESEGFHGGNADRSKKKDRKRMEAQSRLPMSGYVNNNVQGINNSILYNCSFTHHDPGVHFSLSRKPLHGKEEGNGHGIHHNLHPNGKQL